MNTTVADNPKAGRYEVRIDDELAGYITYDRRGSTQSFNAIETDPRRAGQGLGLVLVRGALDASRADGLSVLPVSAFVRDYIERHPVYLDLVPPGQRRRFELPPD